MEKGLYARFSSYSHSWKGVEGSETRFHTLLRETYLVDKSNAVLLLIVRSGI
jgi:hypothetical protein